MRGPDTTCQDSLISALARFSVQYEPQCTSTLLCARGGWWEIIDVNKGRQSFRKLQQWTSVADVSKAGAI